MDTRRVGSLLATAVVLALASCSKAPPVVIGFVGGLSGRVADLGIAGRDGATLAVEERNRAGGVQGRRVELLVRSDEQDPETALRVDGELIGLGAEAIVGHMTSAMSMAALPLAEKARVPLVSPTTTTTELEGRDDHFLRVTATTRAYAARMAGHLRRARGVSSAAVIYDRNNRSYTESWLESFRREFEALGGRVVAEEGFHSGGSVHFEALARAAAGSGADCIVLIASAMDAAMLAQQFRKIGVRSLLACAEWASTEKLLELGGAAAEGMIVSQFFDRVSRVPRYLAFRSAFRERFGEEPGFAAVNAYDAVNVVLRALEQRRPGERVREAILRISVFEGLQGPLTIDRFGDADRASRLAVVEKGVFEVVDGP